MQIHDIDPICKFWESASICRKSKKIAKISTSVQLCAACRARRQVLLLSRSTFLMILFMVLAQPSLGDQDFAMNLFFIPDLEVGLKFASQPVVYPSLSMYNRTVSSQCLLSALLSRVKIGLWALCGKKHALQYTQFLSRPDIKESDNLQCNAKQGRTGGAQAKQDYPAILYCSSLHAPVLTSSASHCTKAKEQQRSYSVYSLQ